MLDGLPGVLQEPEPAIKDGNTEVPSGCQDEESEKVSFVLRW